MRAELFMIYSVLCWDALCLGTILVLVMWEMHKQHVTVL